MMVFKKIKTNVELDMILINYRVLKSCEANNWVAGIDSNLLNVNPEGTIIYIHTLFSKQVLSSDCDI